MKNPTPAQALDIIKNILDAASKSGMFENLNSAVIANNAFFVIQNEINKPAALPGSEN